MPPTAKKKRPKSSGKPPKKPPAPPVATSAPSPDPHDEHRRRATENSRERTERGVDIGDLPPVANPARKEACRLDLKLACETYWPYRFSLAWSQDQLDVIAKLQTVILEGGQFAFAIYRGGGKTTLCEAAATWAELYGHRKFCVVIGATGPAASEILDTVQADLETNDLLLEDFPEAVYPIRKLEGEPRRCARQSYHGERTRIEWGADGVVFADIPGAPCAGAIIHVVGMTGRIRGLKRNNLRPDLLLIDDPQTDESAASVMGNYKRKRIIQRAALKLAGPKKRIACMMPCTIIAPGDMVDQFTDRQQHPEWNGERRRLVHSFPANKDLWDQYRELRAEGMRSGRGEAESTDFYLANRAAMDAGAVVAWPDFTKGKASAIQYVMDEFIDDPAGAAAELNNDPKKDDLPTEMRQLTEEDLKVKLNTHRRGIVPRGLNKLTMFVDIQKELLFWMVCGWNDRFSGAVVDYGCFPDQPYPVFAASDPGKPLSKVFSNQELPARLYSGLAQLIPALLGRAFPQEDANGALTVSLALLDSGFMPDVVHDYISRSPLKALLHASKGRGIAETSKPMNEYRKEPGDWVGWNCRIDARTTAKGRLLTFDTYSWKSFVAELLLAPEGSGAALYLPGDKINEHPLLVQHLLSEYRAASRAESTGRRVEKWFMRPGEREQHWWDCLIGCAVAANRQNISHSPSGQPTPVNESPKPLRLSDLQKQRMAEVGSRYGKTLR